jgi:predicted membrane chloride channel (bestrophin family)
LWLLPSGILNSALLRKLFAALTGAVCMALVAWLLHTFNSFIAAPFTLGAYVLGVWLAGGIDPALLAKARALLRGQPAA